MHIISLRHHPAYQSQAIHFFQSTWATEKTLLLYDDCISHCIDAPTPLPQWYLLLDNDQIIGGAGLIPNDFISRMDLYPWLCALYIEPPHRGHAHGSLLINQAKSDAKHAGFSHLYLATDHIGYYEKYGFSFLALGHHPWGATSRIYSTPL